MAAGLCRTEMPLFTMHFLKHPLEPSSELYCLIYYEKSY